MTKWANPWSKTEAGGKQSIWDGCKYCNLDKEKHTKPQYISEQYGHVSQIQHYLQPGKHQKTYGARPCAEQGGGFDKLYYYMLVELTLEPKIQLNFIK